MKNELDIHYVLKAYQKIVNHGVKKDNAHILNGISAESDFDGYTIVLSDDKVNLTVFFHNKYELDATNKLAEQTFFEKLDDIVAKKFE